MPGVMENMVVHFTHCGVPVLEQPSLSHQIVPLALDYVYGLLAVCYRIGQSTGGGERAVPEWRDLGLFPRLDYLILSVSRCVAQSGDWREGLPSFHPLDWENNMLGYFWSSFVVSRQYF